eukprot:TRINITY_DN5954_c1_g1_i1.p1 TRINITY_DN5954_c1_g1~~TRINITY_DN5954_c1_g1_i1.p1  ORF type:complete len:364 (-),score=147.16 TRINITY_DN5954_c1_g1_i1:50-1087(-)
MAAPAGPFVRVKGHPHNLTRIKPLPPAFKCKKCGDHGVSAYFTCAACKLEWCVDCTTTDCVDKGTVTVHSHELVRQENPPAGWGCDGKKLPGGCKKGYTAAVPAGVKRFHCEKCDWDLCEGCYPAYYAPAAKRLAFFSNLGTHLKRDYTLIIDKSGSMAWDPNGPEQKPAAPGKSRWDEAKKAVGCLAPFVCMCDPDGVTVYFFSAGAPAKVDHVKNDAMVTELSKKHVPGGGTDLAGVLKIAFNDHFAKGGKPETILVITDGKPDSEPAAVAEIIGATKRVKDGKELSMSFIQIGNNTEARTFLKMLDNDLKSKGAVHDIVDAMTVDQMGNMSFADLIYKSLHS